MRSFDPNSRSYANVAPEQPHSVQSDETNVADGSVDAWQIADEPDPWHREMDRVIDEWDEEPTHEKWRRGGKWK